jgi:hypothetical protein
MAALKNISTSQWREWPFRLQPVPLHRLTIISSISGTTPLNNSRAVACSCLGAQFNRKKECENGHHINFVLFSSFGIAL